MIRPKRHFLGHPEGAVIVVTHLEMPADELLRLATIELDTATQQAVSASEASSGVEHTGRQNRALFVFAKMVAHCMTILRVVDTFRSIPQEDALLDHGSIAALSRTAIDAALMTMYISEPALSCEEWDLRRQILFLHDLTNRKRFLRALQDAHGADFEFFENYEEMKKSLRSKIIRLAKSLDRPQKAAEDLATGQKVFIDGARGAAREAGWDTGQFEFEQAYYSNWVHSYPVSFIRANEYGVTYKGTSDFQLGFCALALETVSSRAKSATDRIKSFTGSIDRDPVGPLE